MFQANILSGIEVDTPEACRKAVQCLLDKGPEFVVLTLGSKGAMFGQKDSNGSVMQIEPNKDIIPETVIDTTVSKLLFNYIINCFKLSNFWIYRTPPPHFTGFDISI